MSSTPLRAVSLRSASPAPAPSLADLADRVRQMEGLAARRSLPLLPALAELADLRTGTTCEVSGVALAMALLAGPSRAGEWIAVVGVPDFGLEAAAAFGIDLGRTIVVPDPDEHWLSVTAGLIEVTGAVLVRPPGAVTESQAARLGARLRRCDAALLSLGPWPRGHLRLSAHDPVWSGVRRGSGHLTGCRVTVSVAAPGAPPRKASLLLPGPAHEVVRLGPDAVDSSEAAGWGAERLDRAG